MTEIMERGSADPWKSLQQLALPALCRVSVWFFWGGLSMCGLSLALSKSFLPL